MEGGDAGGAPGAAGGGRTTTTRKLDPKEMEKVCVRFTNTSAAAAVAAAGDACFLCLIGSTFVVSESATVFV